MFWITLSIRFFGRLCRMSNIYFCRTYSVGQISWPHVIFAMFDASRAEVVFNFRSMQPVITITCCRWGFTTTTTTMDQMGS